MNKTKPSQATTTSIRPAPVTSIKFEKVELLNHIVSQIAETRPTTMASNPQQIKSGMSDKVLELLKTRIKTNYDQLYSNYNENKKQILQQIQAVQNNLTGENSMTNRYEEAIKEKSRYDRLKGDLDIKQQKLKRLVELRDNLRSQRPQQSQKEAEELLAQIANSEQKRAFQQHQSAILMEMLRSRRQDYLVLKERYQRLMEVVALKKEKGQKLIAQNLKKQHIFRKLESEIAQSKEVQIPIRLAEELSSKMQQYENQHCYNNIIDHEALLQSERDCRLKQALQQQKETQQIHRHQKELDEKYTFDQLYTLYLIKNLEEEKLKKFCGVESMQHVLDSNDSLDHQNLQSLAKQIESQVAFYDQQNCKVATELEQIINRDDASCQAGTNIYQLQTALQCEERQKQYLSKELEKREDVATHWKTIISLLNAKMETDPELLDELERQYLTYDHRDTSEKSRKDNVLVDFLEGDEIQ